MTAVQPLFPWQAKEIAEHAHDAKRAIFASPRLGKTRAAIESLRVAVPLEARTLVVAPLVVAPYWAEQLEQAGYNVMRAYGMTVNTVTVTLAMDEPQSVIVLNYDKVPLLETPLTRWKPVALIADESHYLKSPTSERGKVVRRIARRAKWIRLLTGTPTPNHYGDLWGQMACLNNQPLTSGGWGTWKQFREHYLVMDPVFTRQVRGHVNTTDLQERLLRSASFVRREDVFGPDQYQEVVREIALPPAARRFYDRLASEWIIEATDAHGDVRADHILKRLTRLQQVAAGFVPDETKVIHQLHSAKIDAVRADLGEIIEAGEKVVIFSRFRWECAQYIALAREMLGDRAMFAWEINGDVETSKREMIRDAFNGAVGSAIIVAQTKSAGIGISLREADHVMFTTQSFSFSDEDQARDRVYAQNETGVLARCVTYYVVEDSVDEYIREVIAAKTNIHESVRLADRHAMAFGRIGRSRRRIA